jgi:signal transduction histidine kinase/ActR/RegA family two-component response regulator
VTDLVPANDRPNTDQLWTTLRSEGRQRGMLNLARADGGIRNVEFSATANFVPGRHLSVLRDVTERQRAEAAVRFLAAASERLGSSLDYERTLAAVATLCVPTIADWAAVDMLGADRSLQRLAVAHVDPAKVALAHELLRRQPMRLDDPYGVARVLRTGEPDVMWHIADEFLAANIRDTELLQMFRTLGLTSSMVVPLKVREKTVGAITLVTSAESGRRFNESDLVIAQEVARRASVAVENAMSYREAQEASRLKDEFLATVSHELRTPLTAVLGWATLVRARQADPAYVAKGLDTIERNARAQAQLIEDLLDLSRIITGKLRLEVKPVHVGTIVETALDTIRPAANAKGITLEPVVDENALPIMGDSDRLLQVVNNLLTNAVKFTGRGGRIRVDVQRIDASVEIVVRDDGQGIAPDFLPHVFERFRQADGSTTRTQGGLGLGLAISRSLVEMHGGTIAVESAGEGHGATFTVRLPIAPLRSPSMPASATPQRIAGRLELDCPPLVEGLRILVVDDEPDTRELLRAVLEHCKAKVTLAASAAGAIELLRANRYDVLVSDIGMPGEDGYSLIRKVRALPEEQGRYTPAIALTAYASAQDRTRAMLAGFDTHMTKPVEAQEFIVTIAHVLGRLSRPEQP